MNLQIFTPENISTNTRVVKQRSTCLVVVLMSLFLSSQALSWEIDLSRRRKNVTKHEAAPEVSNTESSDVSFLDNLLPVAAGPQEIVILSTENGFVPKTVKVKKDQPYTVYVVNVNEKEKNVSFILDSFSEHHGTYFGKIKKFEITPRKEGMYSFQCPETAAEGRLVVFTGEMSTRGLSSQGE